MPSTPSAHGSHLHELPGGVHPIAGVSTSDTAFVDWFPRGPEGTATRVSSFEEFENVFGGLHAQSCSSYAVFQYFLNEGSTAWVVRVALAGGAGATVLATDGTASDAPAMAAAVTGALPALERIEPLAVSILCLPVSATLGDSLHDLIDAAASFCEQHRIFLIVDPPVGADSRTAAAVGAWLTTGTNAPAASKNAAVYWPRLVMSDPLAGGDARDTGPSGVAAGIFARTDAAHGVWKAPAGMEALVRGAEPAVTVTSSDSAALGSIGVNTLRTLPGVGTVVWGARTLVGADPQAGEWKYVPVRRTALFIEQSLSAGLQWVVFEPNGDPLWSQIRREVGEFMEGLFRKGAFQGRTSREAYFVRCDQTTTTASDVDKGLVNILVGFAPLKPAEYVVIQIRQMAGQARQKQLP